MLTLLNERIYKVQVVLILLIDFDYLVSFYFFFNYLQF